MSNLPVIKNAIMSIEERRARNEKMIAFSRSLLDFVFGLLILALGVIFIKDDHFGIKSDLVTKNDPTLLLIFGIVCVIYGVWRFYRGYVKIKN